MSTSLRTHASTPRHRRVGSRQRSNAAIHGAWFAAGAALAFVVPYLGTTVLELQHDLYLGIYFAFVAALIYGYARSTGTDLRAVATRRLVPSLLIALPILAFLILNVWSEDATARPDGWYFAFELIWRGGIYGVMDALLLTAFPCMVMYALLGGSLPTWGRRIGYAVGSLALVMVITATYHLGYEQYRRDGVRVAELGNVVMSVPALLTTNPIGSVVDHSGMHVAAVIHEYETEDRLPPAQEVDD